ncbi:MAG: glycosyltransferase family 2 protein [Sphingobacteriia bacterium]|nr:MAG: glycosyltransferase family 2 protein [Sphingobacteriia bacterium]TAG31812.1 MAG: glycosyltransferase family 2 protein [Sphingobacteriia bacterium]TAH07821.1 MAG: glycosyltransferase family 2 protein [Sphingobacteriia bacterium]
MKTVSIVTVNYNHSHVTDALLDSIFSENEYPNLEIIVVDNDSIINPIPSWEVKYSSVQFIRAPKNLGFAGGNNLGLSKATGDYLFFVNNDTVFTKNLITTLVNTMERNSAIGMISPKLLYYEQPDMLQYAGYTKMNYYTARNSCIGQFEQDKGQYDHLVGPTGFAHGAAMMLTKAAIDKVGPMAENYFLYYEELDWADRIKRAGMEVWVNMKATIYHKESISVGKQSALKIYYMNRNRLLFIRRNASLIPKLFFYMYFICVVVPRNMISYWKDGQVGFITQLWRAIWWNFTNGINSVYLGFKS